MNLDFLEIGTSNFRTLIQSANDTTYGMSVEPLSEYLNQLPNPKNVIKVNCAVSFTNDESDIEIYYIPEHIIRKENLPEWLKGCNCLSTYHVKHKELGVEKFVKIQKVKQIPISKLLTDYKIVEINHLKIDTEGGDCYILNNLHLYLKDKPKNFLPKKITFETNDLTSKDIVNQTIQIYQRLGYRLGKKRKQDTVLIVC